MKSFFQNAWPLIAILAYVVAHGFGVGPTG
jgi:hypothetical protein